MVEFTVEKPISLCPFSQENDINYKYIVGVVGYDSENDYIKVETPLPSYMMWVSDSVIHVFTKHPIKRINYQYKTDKGSGSNSVVIKD